MLPNVPTTVSNNNCLVKMKKCIILEMYEIAGFNNMEPTATHFPYTTRATPHPNLAKKPTAI